MMTPITIHAQSYYARQAQTKLAKKDYTSIHSYHKINDIIRRYKKEFKALSEY